jgi:hypothetical protein
MWAGLDFFRTIADLRGKNGAWPNGALLICFPETQRLLEMPGSVTSIEVGSNKRN